MNSRARGVALSTIGYLTIAIGTWMISMNAADWYTGAHSAAGGAILFPLSIVLLVIGILAFVQNRGLDSVVFFGGAAVLGGMTTYLGVTSSAAATSFNTSVSTMATQAAHPLSYLGWIACMFGIYFLCTWAGSIRSGRIRSFFLLALWLSLGCLAIAGWADSAGWMIAGGYLGLISAVLAFAIAGTEIVRYGRMVDLNNTLEETRTVRPMAAD